MDVPDAGEYEVKLYKAAGDLLPEIRYKLPQLFWHPEPQNDRLRTHVLDSKTRELVQLLDRFQEWPQLLDPHLAELAQVLLNGFLDYLINYQDQYFQHQVPEVSPLPRSVCQVLYALCKVRGYKIIVRLLNNEPRYIEPMLSSFNRWKNPGRITETHATSGMIWEERYVIILWLSHLMLAPFQLSTISAKSSQNDNDHLHELTTGLPEVAKDVLTVAFSQLRSPSKEREAACILLVRLVLRRDMQELSLPLRLVKYSVKALMTDEKQQNVTIHHHLGLLSLLYGIINLGADSEIAPFLMQTFQLALEMATSTSLHIRNVQNSAPARKLVLKIIRACMTHAVSLASTPNLFINDDALNSMLEDGIQHFLDALKDKDTPVRMAASKALSVVALNLKPMMSAEVVEAVLGSLSEDVLFEDLHKGRLTASTEGIEFDPVQMKKNLSAVDPLRWQGLMLTLGHLLFRRSPPPYQLSDIIEALVLGLDFEQRSNVGTSVGVIVRDAACFGIWALSRKYSTHEVESIDVSQIRKPLYNDPALKISALQFLAEQLVVSACFDPSGNIRRGSSAALQELVGRHPDTILHGIPLVQAIDYHAVARRSKAMIDVADQAASLDPTYRQELLKAILGWRGARAADAESRRSAAIVCETLLTEISNAELLIFLQQIRKEIEGLKSANLGINAAARHGLLLCLAGVIQCAESTSRQKNAQIHTEIGSIDIRAIGGSLDSRTTVDLELVMEALSKVIAAMSQTFQFKKQPKAMELKENWLQSMRALLNRCTIASEKDILVEATSEASLALFNLSDDEGKANWLNDWLNPKVQRDSDMRCKGRLTAMALLCKSGASLYTQTKVLDFVANCLQGNFSIEIKTNSMASICIILSRHPSDGNVDVEAFARLIQRGLTDYTIDQRGDIGSILRLQSLEAADYLFEIIRYRDLGIASVHPLLQHVVRLAGERLNRLRFRAWQCLQRHWNWFLNPMKLSRTFDHVNDVSSEAYYEQLMGLLSVKWLQEHLIKGLISSVAAGTDGISRASETALLLFVLKLPVSERKALQCEISSHTVANLFETALQDDREVVPILHFLAVLIETGIYSKSTLQPTDNIQTAISQVMQKVQSLKASFPRLEASIAVYSALLLVDDERRWALDILTRLLLHRWPKVRNLAAEVLFANTLDAILASCDWNGPVADNKPAVLQLRKSLNVIGTAAT